MSKCEHKNVQQIDWGRGDNRIIDIECIDCGLILATDIETAEDNMSDDNGSIMHFKETDDTEKNTITFHINDGMTEVLKLAPNGDIFAYGKLIENDLDIVTAMRDFFKLTPVMNDKSQLKNIQHGFDVALGDDAVGVGLTVWVHGLVHICSSLVDAVARFIDPAAEFKCVHS